MHLDIMEPVPHSLPTEVDACCMTELIPDPFSSEMVFSGLLYANSDNLRWLLPLDGRNWASSNCESHGIVSTHSGYIDP